VTRLADRRVLEAAAALAAADSAIVVLAMPELLSEFGGSVSDTAWVITAYNLAAAVAGGAVLILRERVRVQPLLLVGALLFAAASVACATAQSLDFLIASRALQGGGGGLLLAGALFALGPATSAAAAAVGAALGPALGAALTDVFDWRAIFVVQLPIALAAVVAAARAGWSEERVASPERRTVVPSVALLFVSGATVGALFLSAVLLVNGHGLSLPAAAGVISLLPLSGLVARRVVRPGSPALGLAVLAAGLALLAIAPQSVWAAAVALACSGAGLGLALPPIGEAAGLPGVAARHAGVVLGLVLLAPLLAHDLSSNAEEAKTQGLGALIRAPLPLRTKLSLGVDLYREVQNPDQGKPPDLEAAFEPARRKAESSGAELDRLQTQLEQLEADAVSDSFSRPFAVSALLAALALAVSLGVSRARAPAKAGLPAGR
jgi:predicted MFS family arabinose efflux permease